MENEITKDEIDNFFLAHPIYENYLGRAALICTLYFVNADTQEMQHNICECVREYVSLIGDEAKCCVSTSSSRFLLAEEGKLELMDEETIRRKQENGSSIAEFYVASHSSGKEYDSVPAKFSLRTVLLLKEAEFAFDGTPLDKEASILSAVFAPSFFLLDKQPLTFTDLVLKWCNALRPLSGVAGWGVSQLSDPWLMTPSREGLARYLLQYPGLDLPCLLPCSHFIQHIASINWLTILCDELAERVGGVERLRSLGKEYPLARYAGGHIIQAGPTPQLGDREHGDVLPLYGKVHDLLRPLYPPLDELTYIANGFYDYDPQTREVNIESPKKAEQNLREFLSLWMNRYSAGVKTPPLFSLNGS